MFRQKKSVKLSYRQQGYVFFTSLNYDRMPEEKRARIRAICATCAGHNADALLEFVTTERTATAICMCHNIASKTTLYRAVRRYYAAFPTDI